MRVLAVHPGLDRYGADLMLMRSLVALRTAGHEVTLLVPEGGPLQADLDDHGITTTIVPFPVMRKALLRPAGVLRLMADLVPTALRIRRLLREHSPDVLYINTITMPHWVLFGRWWGGPRVVCHVRELEENTPALLSRSLLAPLMAAHALLANSNATRRFLGSMWRRLENKCTVVYNGFELATVPRQPRQSGRRRLILVGRLSPRKGQDVALAALASLVDAGEDVELHLLGTTFRGYEWFADELHGESVRRGLQDRVFFRGYVGSVAEEYSAADVALVPSRLEPFGNVAVEAQLAGCPVVVSAVGGLPEIVDDGRTGLVVPPGDVRSLADALHRLFADPPFAAKLASQAQLDATRRFARARYDKEIEAALSAVTRQKHIGPATTNRSSPPSGPATAR